MSSPSISPSMPKPTSDDNKVTNLSEVKFSLCNYRCVVKDIEQNAITIRKSKVLCQTITNSLSSMYKLCVDPLCRAFLYRGFVFSMIILHIKLVCFVSRVFHHSCRELNVLALIYLRHHGKHTIAVWASSSLILALRSLCFFNLLQNLVCKKRKAHFCFCIFFGFLFTHCLIFLFKTVCS
jgi:hypothetical protein